MAGVSTKTPFEPQKVARVQRKSWPLAGPNLKQQIWWEPNMNPSFLGVSRQTHFVEGLKI